MKHLITLLAAGASLSVLSGPALAQDFHGFDPTNFDGDMLAADTLQQMASDAMQTTAPNEGETYTFGFANLQRDIAFGVLVEEGIVDNAEAAGIELVIADNRLDGPTALSNAQSFAQRNVDYVIEFQTDANFGEQIMTVFNDAGIPVTAIDIPMPGANFFGVNNPRSGFMGGSYLAQAATEQFGDAAMDEGYLVIGALPQSGAIPRMRTDGQRNGFLAEMEGFPQDRVIEIDTQNTLQEAYTQMSNVLGRIPPGAPIMIVAINDQATIGMLQAVRAAGRADSAIAVGNGADEAEAIATNPQLAGAVGSFPGEYGNYLIPLALSQLAGNEVPEATFVSHQMVTKANICQFYPEFECQDSEGIDFTFPEEAFSTYLADLREQDWLSDFQAILPEN